MLDFKDSYILNLLISANQPLSIDDFSKIIGASRRSIYYSFNRINTYLESLNLPKVVNKRDKGLFIENIVKETLAASLNDHLQQSYIYTQKERVAIELVMILSNQANYGISIFEKLFDVSRNTIVNDIKVLREYISTFNLSLEYDNKKRYYIDGESFTKRNVILYNLSSFDYLFKINNFGLFSDSDVKEVLKKLNKIETMLGITYVSEILVLLSQLIVLISNSKMEMVELNEEEIELILNTVEYEQVKMVFSNFEQQELLYITLHLLGLRVNSELDLQSQDDKYVTEIVEFMVRGFEEIALIEFDNFDELCLNLYTHMKPALLRYKYGIIFHNHLLQDIIENYPQIYNIVSKICIQLEEMIGYPISENEISYITMHFGGHLRRKKRAISTCRVLLVCLNGIATSKLLKKELEHIIGNVEIDTVSLDEISKYYGKVDYIISTIPIKDKEFIHKTIQVNPILNELDRVKIKSIFREYSYKINSESIYNKIIKDLKRYISKEDLPIIKKMIWSRFQEGIISNKSGGRIRKPMLNELITEEMITFTDKVDTWEDALYLSAKPLLDNGSIEERYIEKVIANVNELGPYIVIAPKVAISHARPKDGVNKLGMTLLILKEPVNFSKTDDKNVNLVVTLASSDDEIHLLALQQLSKILLEELDKVLEANSKETILELIAKYSK